MRVMHKRRREQKTDYRLRLKLLKSGKTRLVIRKSLNNIRVQFINYYPEGDRTEASAFSKELKKFGWNYGTGNLPAAYLTGFIAGLRTKVKEAVLDIGMQMNTKGSRIYAALKGVIDAGVSVPHSQEILPSMDRIMGKHINPDIEKSVKMVIEKLKKEK